MVEKKDAKSRLQNLLLQRVVLSMLMKMKMGENQACKSQVHGTALQCLRFKLRKWGLNRRLKPVLQGGGGWFSHIT
jgi:DNA-binding protein Fis